MVPPASSGNHRINTTAIHILAGTSFAFQTQFIVSFAIVQITLPESRCGYSSNPTMCFF